MKKILIGLAIFAVGIGGVVVASGGLATAMTSKEATSNGAADYQNYDLRRIVIGLDLSASNPLVDDERYARKVAKRIGKDVGTMKFRSEIMIRTFGAYDPSNNPFAYDAVVSARNRPESLKKDVVAFVSSVPGLIDKGVLESQNSTNILAFLENVSEDLDCRDDYKEMPTTVILVTDGVEDSEYANLSHSRGKLPLPDGKIFYRCYELQILGIGRGIGGPKETRRLRDVWAVWSKAAGFKHFTALNDW